MISGVVASPSQILQLFVASHLSLSLLSIINSQLLSSTYKLDDSDVTTQECFDASHYNLVKSFVSRMYSDQSGNISLFRSNNGSRKESEQSTTHLDKIVDGVRLSPAAVFEDSAAVCKGPREIREAFRALRYMNPVSLPQTPLIIDVKPTGETILLTFFLHQQYTLPFYGTLSMRSILEITVQLQQMKELPESEFVIIRMKELWCGKPLSWPYPLYYPSRRLNGLLSYWLTPHVL